MDVKKVGEVHSYDEFTGYAYIRLCAVLKCGDTVHFLGHGSDFQQPVAILLIENEAIVQANAGDLVAVKTVKPVKRSTNIYILSA
ncbi:hypothetical protein C4588_08110 [Candidatus Parcubacteria bacterium]|nr:MAG: hypothetical protein C4588_08110 [Candidatus Parcubacteria bacterium]